jgi:hypothetical protein
LQQIFQARAAASAYNLTALPAARKKTLFGS